MVLPSTSGRPVFYKQKKKFISHRTKKDSHARNGPPTHHGRCSAPSTHPPTKPLLQTAVQQCSGTYSSTPGTRGAVSWLVLEETLYETGSRRGEFHVLTIPGHLGERASRRSPPTHHTPSTHGPTQYSSAAMQQYIEQYTGHASNNNSRFVGYNQCSRARRDLQLFTFPRHAGDQAKSARVADSAHGERRRLDVAVIGRVGY